MENSSVTEEQRVAIECVVRKGNSVVLGPPGSGKSHIIKAISESTPGCSVTATTGLAASLVNGMTVHQFFGLVSGTDASTLASQNPILRDRIEKTQLLIIDEASMLSADQLDIIDDVLRQIKHSGDCFGGVHVALFGDLLQLPPVPHGSDAGKYFFQARCWTRSKFYIQRLSGTHRQDDPLLVKCISQCAAGIVDRDVIELLSARSVPAPPDAVYLAPLNHEVDMFNAQKLGDMPGKVFKVSSKDTGSTRILNDLTITSFKEHLYVKIGCPVVVTRNISSSIKNGTRGVVQSANKDSIVIRLETAELYELHRVSISKFYQGEYHTRQQIPAKLAFGLTVHKGFSGLS